MPSDPISSAFERVAEGLHSLPDQPATYHYLANFTALGGPARPEEIAIAFGRALSSLQSIEVVAATTYTSEIAIDPRQLGLKNVWDTIPDTDKLYLARNWPALITVIEMLAGTTDLIR